MEKRYSVVLYNSKFIGWLWRISKEWKYKITDYSKKSIIIKSIQEVKKYLYSLPVKTGSIILITAISSNIFLSLLLKKEIELFGWVIREVFLFVGFNGLFCNVDWENLKETSFVLRYMDKRR